MRGEHDRLQAVLEAHEARAVASSIPDHHAGLRQRIAGLALKLAETTATSDSYKSDGPTTLSKQPRSH
jgi:hypothetical protein